MIIYEKAEDSLLTLLAGSQRNLSLCPGPGISDQTLLPVAIPLLLVASCY